MFKITYFEHMHKPPITISQSFFIFSFILLRRLEFCPKKSPRQGRVPVPSEADVRWVFCIKSGSNLGSTSLKKKSSKCNFLCFPPKPRHVEVLNPKFSIMIIKSKNLVAYSVMTTRSLIRDLVVPILPKRSLFSTFRP